MSESLPRIILIDANDSFVHNIKDRFLRLGHQLEILPYADFDPNRHLEADALILSPGPGHTSEYPKWFQLLQQIEPHIPVLGICLGFQLLATHYGAKLNPMKQVVHGQQQKCTQLSWHPLWENIPQTFTVGRYHSWEIDPNSLPETLLPLAQTEDACLMAIAHKTLPQLGVQFHPESFMCPNGTQLFKNFLALIPWE